MTLRIALFFSLTVAVLGADDWSKVRELPSGTELRVMKKGSGQPLLLKMDEASESALLAVLKNEQVSIPKDQIDQIEFRPKEKARKTVKETKVTFDDPNGKAPAPAAPHPATVPGSSSSTGFILGSKADFETIYRRVPTPRPVQ